MFSSIIQSILPKFGLSIIKQTQYRQIHSFLKSLPAEKLWKGVTSVSNAGRKRGRAKALRKMQGRNVNIGQVIGVGQANILWPGLSAPILKGRNLVRQTLLPPDLERGERLVKLRDSLRTFRSLKIKNVERGWSGAKIHGRHFGPPDPIGEDTFEGFDSICLELKNMSKMTGHFGRMRSCRCVVFVGNGNGLGGFGVSTGNDSKTILRTARNRGGQKLAYFKLCDERTVYHNFHCQFGRTRIYVTKKPEGFGLICHRAIKAMCELIGIKDIHAKIEGAINIRHIIYAFCIGLLKQKTYEEIAEEKRLHFVEMCPENFYYPNVLASPKSCRTKEEIEPDEILDYQQYCQDGKVVLQRRKPQPFFTKLPTYQNYLKKQERHRNKDKVRRELIAKYGEIRSFHAEKYPEARANYISDLARIARENPE